MRKAIIILFLTGAIASFLALACIMLDMDLRARFLAKFFAYPSVTITTSSPEAEGLDRRKLLIWTSELERFNTSALLILRSGKIAYEWYSPSYNVNKRHYTAALAKGLSGITTLLVCLSDGVIKLDDPLWKYYPPIKTDKLRSKIKIRDLAFHRSGIDNVSFPAGKKVELSGWQKEYYDNDGVRFHFAMQRAPILFEPGSREQYSGVGYYALAYAVTKALQNSPYSTIYQLYKKRIAEPLSLPDNSWSISYGESYPLDGMRMYAFGSGGAFTARAAAKIGELMLQRGEYQGHRIFSEYWYNRVILSNNRRTTEKIISTNHGWTLNLKDKWSSLPKDAYVSIGGGHQLVLVVPSQDMVVVRFGDTIRQNSKIEDNFLNKKFFLPLMESITGKSKRQQNIQ